MKSKCLTGSAVFRASEEVVSIFTESSDNAAVLRNNPTEVYKKAFIGLIPKTDTPTLKDSKTFSALIEKI